MQPEASRRACVVKEPLSSYRGACRSTWAVTAEGQSPEAQPRADHDLFPSSGGAGLRACEGWAQCRALPAPTERSPAPAALPGTRGCWSWRDCPSHGSLCQFLQPPQEHKAATGWHLLECQGFHGHPGDCTGAPARLFRFLLLILQNLRSRENALFVHLP